MRYGRPTVTKIDKDLRNTPLTSSHLIQAAVTGDLLVDGCNVGQIPSPEQKQHEFSGQTLYLRSFG
jgi:hypothetical protein